MKFEVQSRMGLIEEQGLAKKVNITESLNKNEDSLRRIEEKEFVLED